MKNGKWLKAKFIRSYAYCVVVFVIVLTAVFCAVSLNVENVPEEKQITKAEFRLLAEKTCIPDDSACPGLHESIQEGIDELGSESIPIMIDVFKNAHGQAAYRVFKFFTKMEDQRINKALIDELNGKGRKKEWMRLRDMVISELGRRKDKNAIDVLLPYLIKKGYGVPALNAIRKIEKLNNIPNLSEFRDKAEGDMRDVLEIELRSFEPSDENVEFIIQKSHYKDYTVRGTAIRALKEIDHPKAKQRCAEVEREPIEARP